MRLACLIGNISLGKSSLAMALFFSILLLERILQTWTIWAENQYISHRTKAVFYSPKTLKNFPLGLCFPVASSSFCRSLSSFRLFFRSLRSLLASSRAASLRSRWQRPYICKEEYGVVSVEQRKKKDHLKSLHKEQSINNKR